MSILHIGHTNLEKHQYLAEILKPNHTRFWIIWLKGIDKTTLQRAGQNLSGITSSEKIWNQTSTHRCIGHSAGEKIVHLII